jgi:hypothetical protein
MKRKKEIDKKDLEILHDWSETFPFSYEELLEIYNKNNRCISIVRSIIFNK